MGDCTGESPILFSSCDELPDEDDFDDVVPDTHSVNITEPLFGAYLKTHRSSPEERTKGQRFHHLMHHMDSSKKHGLFEQLREGDELIAINETDVRSCSHDAVMKTILELEEKITFQFYRKSENYIGLIKETDVLYIKIVFRIDDLGADDKGIISDITSHIVKVSVEIQKRITDSQRLVVLKCTGMREMKLRHGAQIHNFLMIKKNKPVMKRITSDDNSEADTFNVYNYVVNDEELKKERYVIAIQCKQTGQFLMCTPGQKLSMVKDDDINPKMTDIAHNSPYLFFITVSQDGDDTFYFESVAYPGKFLEYEFVDGLCVKKLRIPPYSSSFRPTDCIRCNFTFALLCV